MMPNTKNRNRRLFVNWRDNKGYSVLVIAFQPYYGNVHMNIGHVYIIKGTLAIAKITKGRLCLTKTIEHKAVLL